MNLKEVFDFYKGKRVLVTGHTGFKGTWLSRILVMPVLRSQDTP